MQRGKIVRELINEVNSLFTVNSNQFTSLFLYNNHVNGHWIEEEDKPIEYYGLRDMDIIEIKEKPTYKITVKGNNNIQNDEIQFDKLTTISNFIIMLICWSPTPIDDPSLAGIYIIKKDKKLLDPPVILERSKLIGDYELKKDDELQFFVDFRDTNSCVETFVISSDPDYSPVLIFFFLIKFFILFFLFYLNYFHLHYLNYFIKIYYYYFNQCT